MIPIIKRELAEIAGSRRYMLSVVFQTLAVISLLPFFTGFLAGGNLALPVPTLGGFVPVYVEDPNGYLLPAIQNDARLVIVAPEKAACRVTVEGGREITVKIEPFRGVKKYLCTSIVKEHALGLEENIRKERLEKAGLPASGLVQIHTKYTRTTTVVKGEKKYSSFFLEYLLPLVLLFPAFFSGALVMHTIVGEKDRKTLEPLITAPIPRERIVYAKFFVVWIFLSLQTAIWIFLIRMIGIPVEHAILSFILLSGVVGTMTSLATVYALLSENSKEASISMMIIYIMFFIAIVVSLSVQFFISADFFDFIPFNLLSKLISGGKFPYSAFILDIGILSIISYVFLWLGGRLINRDDIVFGGRANLSVIFSEAAEGYFDYFSGRKSLGSGIFVILLSPAIFLMAVAGEFLLAFLILFLMGIGWLSIAILVVAAAGVEEILKLLPLIPLKLRGWLTGRRSVFLGAFSGFCFFVIESMLMAYFLFPGVLGLMKFLFLRSASTLLVHIFSSSIGGMWIYTGERRYLAIAILLHAIFNLLIVEVAI